MKKIIAIFMLLILILIVTSCNKPRQFDVLEVGGYDNISGANHQEEIDLNVEVYKKMKLNSKESVNINGNSINGDYLNSQKGYLFNNDLDYYESNANGTLVQFGINNNSGRVDSYSWVSKNYIEEKDGELQNRDQCLDKATEYLNQFVDATDYTLIEERFLEIPEYKAIYNFEFVRVINGVKTSDTAYIGVSVLGDVISHLFITLGEMENAMLPSDEEFEIIENNIDEKIQTIYDKVSNEYNYSFEIEDTVLVKLSNGKYALEYYIAVELEPLLPSAKSITETTKLLIYIE